MSGLFISLYYFFQSHRRLFYTLLATVFATCIFFAIQIKFQEDIGKFLPDNEQYADLNSVFDNIRLKDDVIVMIGLKDSTKTDTQALALFADSIATRIDSLNAPLIRNLRNRVPENVFNQIYELVYSHLPIFLTDSDYARIDSLTNDSTIASRIQSNYHTLLSPAGFAMARYVKNDPLGINGIALEKLRNLQVNNRFEIIDEHLFTNDQRYLLLFISPKHPAAETRENGKLIASLENMAHEAETQTPYEIRLYGGPVFSVANANRLKKDTMLTLTLALIIIVGFISIYFGRKSASLLLILPVIFGAAFSLAIIFLIKGSISIIAIGAGSVVLGIALSYSIHVLNHYRHTGSVTQVISDLTAPLTLGGFTTIGAFLSLHFLSSEALKDFGLFSGLSLIGTSLFCLTAMPQLLKPAKNEHNTSKKIHRLIDRLTSIPLESKPLLVGGICLLTIFFFFFSRQVTFDNNLMSMNYMPPKVAETEQILNGYLAQPGEQNVYLVARGKSINEALEKNEQVALKLEKLKQQHTIESYSTLSPVLISKEEQQHRINRWNNYWTTERKQQVTSSILTKGAKTGFKEHSFELFINQLNKSYQPIDLLQNEVITRYLINDRVTLKPGLALIASSVTVKAADRTAAFEQLTSIKEAIPFDKAYFTAKMIEIISADFNLILYITSLLVFLTLLLVYGRIEIAVMTFLPMLISWIWILGIMGVLGLHFNIINIILSTFIFGLGDDFAIFIMDGKLNEYRTGKPLMQSHKTAIFLSAFTTLVGVGVLIFGKHPALRSIAGIAIIGLLSVLLIAYTVQPLLFNLLIKNRTQAKKSPHTLKTILSTLFVFLYFVLGSFFTTLISLIIYILPIKRHKREYMIHRILQLMIRNILWISPSIRRKIENPLNEDFSKPAIIIANHQSFIDILLLLSLNPKMIMLTNDWVWNSPVFGRLVRLAGFFTSSFGYEQGLVHFREKMNQGYSIIIFPEGTRSADCKIKRFHKGAFHLAEQLQVDILPIVLHGPGLAIAKGDFYLKDSLLTIRFLPRINHSDTQYGLSYQERSKSISKYFKSEYEKLSIEANHPVNNPYFRFMLIKNFTFKGPVEEWYTRIKLRMERYYEPFHKLIPLNATITDIGCGYGYMPFMLTMLSEHRKVTGIDYDENKIEVANSCFMKNEQVRFFAANAVTFPVEPSDVFILSDILHYLTPDDQTQVVTKCINNLNPGGIIIIRDGDTTQQKRHRVTRLSEFLSTHIGFNKGTFKSMHFFSRTFIEQIASNHGLTIETSENDRVTSNTLFVIRNK